MQPKAIELASIHDGAAALTALQATCLAPDSVEGAAELLAYAETAEVSASNLEAAQQAMQVAHEAFTEVEGLRVKAKAPSLAIGKAIDALAATILDPTKRAKALLKDKVAAVLAVIAEAHEKAQTEAFALAASGESDAAAEATTRANALAEVNTDSLSFDWRWECLDESQVERQWCAPDYAKIAKAGRGVAVPPNIGGGVWHKIPKTRVASVRKANDSE